MLVGRKNEIKKLNKLCSSEESKLVALYGRRRIGKTYLIDFMFKEHRDDCLFFEYTGDFKGDKDIQLINFAESIFDWFHDEIENDFENWTKAFNYLKRVITKTIKDTSHKGKVVLFLDEISWIDKSGRNGFLSALGDFWNKYCVKQKNFVMILCGSNASWIKEKVLQDGFGPHNQRVDVTIPLEPFTLEETAEYLTKVKKLDLDSKLLTEIYMIFGGVAKYLSFYDRDIPLAKNVDNLFFNVHGLLHGEYERLFRTLFNDKDALHHEIMNLLCNKRSGYTTVEIANELKLEQNNTKLRDTLKELFACSFISSLTRISNEINGKYIVSDPFCLFYKYWVEPLSKNDIVKLNNYWENIMEEDRYPIWTGFSFEMVCIKNIHLYLKERGLEGMFKSVQYWNFVKNKDSDKEDKGAQIDLLVEYKNNNYDIVECKYVNSEFSITQEEYKKILNKKEMLIKHGLKNKKYDIKLIMLTTYGTKINRYYNNLPINDDIKLNNMLGMED